MPARAKRSSAGSQECALVPHLIGDDAVPPGFLGGIEGSVFRSLRLAKESLIASLTITAS